MSTQERLELHRKLAEGCHRAWREGPKLGKIVFPEELVLADGAVFWCPVIDNGAEISMPTDGGMTLSQIGTAEFIGYWEAAPDLGIVADEYYHAHEDGFALRHTYGGTTKDGRSIGYTEVCHVTLNEQGQVIRWDIHADAEAMNSVVGLTTGRPLPLTWDTWGVGVGKHAEEAARRLAS
jgi:hypothetical protein